MFKMATESTVKTFFNSPQFAVVGASTNPAKFGHKGKSKGPFYSFNPTPQFRLKRAKRGNITT